MVIFHEHVAQGNNDWVTLRKHLGERVGTQSKNKLGNALGTY